MVSLHEQIEIEAPFERLLAWAGNFEEEFVRWSPLHLACQLFDKGIKKGDRVRFHEIVMGMDYDVSGTIIESEFGSDSFKVCFESDRKSAVIIFEGERCGTGCRFSHTERFGLRTPVMGPIMNFLIFKVLYKKKANWDLIRDDMRLDNLYLRRILTKGEYPERIPLEEIKHHTPGELIEKLRG